jgi:hypothetical protein
MAIPDPLIPYRKVQATTEREMRLILESTAKAIENRIKLLRPGVGGKIRAAQLRLTLASIRKLQRDMWTGAVAPQVARGVVNAEEAAESAVEAMTAVAYAALPEQVAETLVRGLRASAESGLKSDAARKKRALSAMVYRQRALHEGKVEQIIRQGLIANLSAKELAASAYKYVSPNTPGGASYAAMRLARTEINNAFHERQLNGAKRPGVKAVKWNLSGSHRVPDLCNVYADHGGNGQWSPDKVPDKPHPQCFCFLTYVTESADDFKAALESGKYDDEIDRRTRENMARLGQPVGDLNPVSESKSTRKTPLTGQAAHDVVPKGLFKRGSLTPKQRTELKQYESGWFVVLNAVLRRKLWDDPDYKRDVQTVQVLQGAVRESILPEPIQTWRGMFNARSVFGDSFDGNLEGFSWDDLGFGSTTTDESIVDLFNLKGEARTERMNADVKMKVSIPAGVGALETSTPTKGSKANGPQAEITLQDGLTWKVVKDHGINPEGVRELEVQVYPIGTGED